MRNFRSWWFHWYNALMVVQGTFDLGPTEIFTTATLASMLDVSLDEVDYWVRAKLLSPSVQQSLGPGTRRLFNLHDVMTALFIRRLLNAGWKCKQVGIAVKVLQDVLASPERFQNPQLIHDGSVLLILCRNREGEPILMDAVHPQQTVLSIVLETLAEEAVRRAVQFK